MPSPNLRAPTLIQISDISVNFKQDQLAGIANKIGSSSGGSNVSIGLRPARYRLRIRLYRTTEFFSYKAAAKSFYSEISKPLWNG